MNFGSKFVYVGRVPPPSARAAATGWSAASTSTAAVPRTASVDTNLLAVKFDVLQTPAQMHTGDVIKCTNNSCRAALSHISKLSAADHLNLALKVQIFDAFTASSISRCL